MGKKNSLKNLMKWDQEDQANNAMGRNEIQANKTFAITLINLVVVNFIALILARLNIFVLDDKAQLYVLILNAEFLIPAIICFILKGRGRWIKYLLLSGLELGLGVIYMLNSSAVLLAMIIPIVLSGRYYSPKFVTIASLFTMIMIAVGAVCGVLYGVIDITALTEKWFSILADGTITDPKYWKELILETLEHSVLISEMLCLLIAYISISSSIKGRNLAQEEMSIISNNARIASELSLATDIQANMLPRIFPPFPDHEEFDIYAKNEPAKEVGGDFYDFFMVDDTHVAIVVGDVSGKGVPAALFMVTAKTLIKDYTQLGLAPAEVFTRINKTLCEGNTAGLFVTAWMGVLDLKTGIMTYVNAGHNAPYLYKKDTNEYEKLSMRPGFVLAGLDTTKYKQAEIKLNKDDRIFLYTDGITEATSQNEELYGEYRMLKILNSTTNLPIVNVLTELRSDVDAFCEGAPQFDDMTMLILSMNHTLDNGFIEKTFTAEESSLPLVTDFMNEVLEKNEVSLKVLNQMDVALEELFVNITHYAYPNRVGDVIVAIGINNNEISVILKDRGIPFNPLDKNDPDITLNAEEREIGGLGIFMVKKTMDAIEYQNKDGMNMLTIKKRF